MDPTDALVDIVFEFGSCTSGRMDRSGRAAIRSVYEQTVEPFAVTAERDGVDVWESGRFRAFILNEVRKICKAALEEAGESNITGEILNRAAVDVMTETEKTCTIAIEEGEIRMAHPKGLLHGPVCLDYLRSQMD